MRPSTCVLKNSWSGFLEAMKKNLSIGNTLYFTPETRMFMRLIKNIYARKNYDEMEHSEDEPEEEY